MSNKNNIRCRLDDKDCTLTGKLDIMFKRVEEIHTSIHGNGSPGLKSKQAVLEAKVNLCIWIISIFMVGIIGVTVKNNMDKPKYKTQEQPQITIVK